jgi:hypothetical protein
MEELSIGHLELGPKNHQKIEKISEWSQVEEQLKIVSSQQSTVSSWQLAKCVTTIE